ncbi:hypothetical protein [Streptomyces sp. NPDC060022]|uniref:hypothetical protein n=1 Tax=Streptomyces sp. NPDC060022 TaxID=3347039 RepID=UPI0036B1C947
MLCSLSESHDAVQEAWLKLSHSDVTAVQNLGDWLTTVVGRIWAVLRGVPSSRRMEWTPVAASTAGPSDRPPSSKYSVKCHARSAASMMPVRNCLSRC